MAPAPQRAHHASQPSCQVWRSLSPALYTLCHPPAGPAFTKGREEARPFLKQLGSLQQRRGGTPTSNGPRALGGTEQIAACGLATAGLLLEDPMFV